MNDPRCFICRRIDPIDDGRFVRIVVQGMVRLVCEGCYRTGKASEALDYTEDVS